MTRTQDKIICRMLQDLRDLAHDRHGLEPGEYNVGAEWKRPDGSRDFIGVRAELISRITGEVLEVITADRIGPLGGRK